MEPNTLVENANPNRASPGAALGGKTPADKIEETTSTISDLVNLLRLEDEAPTIWELREQKKNIDALNEAKLLGTKDIIRREMCGAPLVRCPMLPFCFRSLTCSLPHPRLPLGTPSGCRRIDRKSGCLGGANRAAAIGGRAGTGAGSAQGQPGDYHRKHCYARRTNR